MNDPVEHPSHYTQFGVEVIDITEHLNFCRGNAVKYLCRAGLKSEETELEDLRKALWYVQREISRVESEYARSLREEDEAFEKFLKDELG